MKKLSKRFLTLAIACVMAMAMAVPAFADFDNGTTHTYHIKNNTIAGDYVYLNLYGTGGVYASRDVTVYPRTTSDDQVWYITNKVRDVKKCIITARIQAETAIHLTSTLTRITATFILIIRRMMQIPVSRLSAIWRVSASNWLVLVCMSMR